MVPTHEQINVPNMIRFKNNDRGWRIGIEPLPNLGRIIRWFLRI
jgi:hypothetical protein